jgi:hypothetical protein
MVPRGRHSWQTQPKNGSQTDSLASAHRPAPVERSSSIISKGIEPQLRFEAGAQLEQLRHSLRRQTLISAEKIQEERR